MHLKAETLTYGVFIIHRDQAQEEGGVNVIICRTKGYAIEQAYIRMNKGTKSKLEKECLLFVQYIKKYRD